VHWMEILLTLSLIEPRKRAQRLKELGLEEGKIWQAMVKE
jgi:hypothetical protein